MDQFLDMTIVSELTVKETETGRNIGFRARRFSYKVSEQKLFFFQAWDSAVDKILALKLKPGSKCHIFANADIYCKEGKSNVFFKVFDISISEAGSMNKIEKNEKEEEKNLDSRKTGKITQEEILALGDLEELFATKLPDDFAFEK